MRFFWFKQNKRIRKKLFWWFVNNFDLIYLIRDVTRGNQGLGSATWDVLGKTLCWQSAIYLNFWTIKLFSIVFIFIAILHIILCFNCCSILLSATNCKNNLIFPQNIIKFTQFFRIKKQIWTFSVIEIESKHVRHFYVNFMLIKCYVNKWFD